MSSPVNNTVKKADILNILALCLLVYAVYSNNIINQFVNYDDDAEIVFNPAFENLNRDAAVKLFTEPVIHGFYTPAKSFFSFIIFYLWDGDRAFYFHYFKDILHLLVVINAYILVLLLSNNRFTAFFTCLVFAVHPSQSSVINRATDAGYLLAGYFAYASLIFYLLYKNRVTPRQGALKTRLYYVLSLISYMLGAISMPQAITLPLIIVFYELFVANKNKTPAANLAESFKTILPYLGLTVFYFGVVFHYFTPSSTARPLYELFGNSALYKFFALLYTALYYAVIPPLADIGLDVYMPSITSFFYYFKIAAALGAASACIMLASKIEKWMPILPVIFITFLLPNLLMIQNVVNFSFRYLYLPSIAVYAFFGGLLGHYISGPKSDRALKYCAAGLYIALVVTLAVNTHARNRHWHNSTTLWESLTRGENSQKILGYLKLGLLTYDKSPGDSITYLKNSIAIANTMPKDGYTSIKKFQNANYIHLTRLLTDPKEIKESYQAWQRQLPKNPHPSYLLGSYYARAGESKLAKTEFDRAYKISITPAQRLLEVSASRDYATLRPHVYKLSYVYIDSPVNFGRPANCVFGSCLISSRVICGHKTSPAAWNNSNFKLEFILEERDITAGPWKIAPLLK